jgi:precorrin-2 dehydrogenase/sirohydrochlorin ferrochelatase
VVTVVSPDVIHVMQELVRQHDVTWRKKKYEPEDIEHAMLVIAATNHKAVNRDIAEQAKDHQLVNVVDQPELGNFQVPAVLRRGKLTITVSTDGASPILARKIRDDLSGTYDERYEAYFDFLNVCRERIKAENMSPERKSDLLKQLLDAVYNPYSAPD